ncbi:histidine kinase [Enterococcus sp. DIV1298c]|uniref:cache domain-containing sensor histidine kinase n=1 Tax=Enterococcus sp. DIV1298c TaxID=2815328 RepID=UPI001A9369F4|nr:sensor histidine kinase [Enterococcus sp. DIV1298c]MBO0461442.1 histidine kinase [Enterococcus sp. DIV1298c]
MIKKLREHELLTKLLLILFIALFAQAATISLFIYHRSREAYIEQFDQSNRMTLQKIQHDFETLNDNIENTLTLLAESSAVEGYFKEGQQTTLEKINQLRTVQKMNDSLAPIFPNIKDDIFLFGENGRMFISNDMVSDLTADDFFQLELIQKVNANPTATQMVFTQFGLTKRDKHSPSVLFIKKLRSTLNQTYGYAVVAITSDELAKIFSQSVDPQITQIDFVTDDKKIFASNLAHRIGTTFDSFDQLNENETLTKANQRITRLPLYRQNSALVSEVNVHSIADQMGVILPIILYNIAILFLGGIVVYIYLNRNTKSIYQLVDSLKQIKEPVATSVPVQGTYEIRTLSTTINQLLTTISDNHTQSLQNEQKKRALEIQAMQAQIQPHFIYNTLTSLKFLVWQQENEKAVSGIDSFIDLLRSTIGNKNEIIPVEEELKSVKSYIAILTLRYGEAISTKIMVPEELYSLYMPNMIIQPIIENAYLHAFQLKKSGFITLYAMIREDTLTFEVVDTGDGYDTEQSPKNRDYFSGIGSKNVHERIQLLYGADYGLHIDSVLGVGTSVTITLPIIKTPSKHP